MNILITGGAGYIGSELVQHFLDDGHEVTAYDNIMYDCTSLLRYTTNKKFNFVNGDVRNFKKLKPYFSEEEYSILNTLIRECTQKLDEVHNYLEDNLNARIMTD